MPRSINNSEIVFVSFASNSGYSDGVLYIYDASTFALKWESPTNLFGNFAWTGVHDLAIGDVDNDGRNEIVVGTDQLYNGAIYIIDGVNHTVKNSYIYDSGAESF